MTTIERTTTTPAEPDRRRPFERPVLRRRGRLQPQLQGSGPPGPPDPWEGAAGGTGKGAGTSPGPTP